MRISDWSSDVCSSDLSPVSCAPSKCGGKIDMASSHTDIIVDQVLELDPATLDVSGRVGLFFPEKAEAYAALIARDGQRTPITVRRNGSRAQPHGPAESRAREGQCGYVQAATVT